MSNHFKTLIGAVMMALTLLESGAFSDAQMQNLKTQPQDVKPMGDAASIANTDSEDELADTRDPFVSSLPIKSETKVVPLSTEGQNPSQPGPGEAFDYASLKITGVVWGSDKPNAIINDDVVGVGSVVNGAEIMAINADGILFRYKDQNYFMKRQGQAGNAKSYTNAANQPDQQKNAAVNKTSVNEARGDNEKF
jgi:hypothetical protein